MVAPRQALVALGCESVGNVDLEPDLCVGLRGKRDRCSGSKCLDITLSVIRPNLVQIKGDKDSKSLTKLPCGAHAKWST